MNATPYQIRTVLGGTVKITQQLARQQPVANALAILEGRLCPQTTLVEKKATLQKVSSLDNFMFTCQRNHNDYNHHHHACNPFFTLTTIHPQRGMVCPYDAVPSALLLSPVSDG